MSDTFTGYKHRPVAVTDVSGNVVAFLCMNCDQQLPVNWACRDCQWVETTTLSDPEPRYVLYRSCEKHRERLHHD